MMDADDRAWIRRNWPTGGSYLVARRVGFVLGVLMGWGLYAIKPLRPRLERWAMKGTK